MKRCARRLIQTKADVRCRPRKPPGLALGVPTEFDMSMKRL